MFITEVVDKKSKKEFLDVARIIYKNDPTWVCPLDSEIEGVFDPKVNVFFEHGVATRWILRDAAGNLIGRVAAFINNKKAFNFQQPTGGMGFFECIKDQNAANILFEQCQTWLKGKGMLAMDGPINFGENDRFWGLLVEGFTHPGYGMPYNKDYYKELFENYGFKFYFEQVSNHLDLRKPFPERFKKIAQWVFDKPGYTFKHYEKAKSEEFIKDFVEIYNTAWAFHENFTPINPEDIRRTLKKAEPIMEEKFIWFAYVDGVPSAFLIMFPDANQIMKHLNGKLNMINKLRFVYLKWRKTMTRARIVIMGVIPKYQKAGLESSIFMELEKVMKTMPHYTELELSWVGDFNPKMRHLHESVGAVFAKKHVTYRKLFEDTIAFDRSTIIPVDTKEKALGLKK